MTALLSQLIPDLERQLHEAFLAQDEEEQTLSAMGGNARISIDGGSKGTAEPGNLAGDDSCSITGQKPGRIDPSFVKSALNHNGGSSFDALNFDPLASAGLGYGTRHHANDDDCAANIAFHQGRRRISFWGGLVRIAALLALLMGIIGQRQSLVHVMPALAPFYQAVGLNVLPHGLAISHFSTSLQDEQNQPVLIVEGDVDNSQNDTTTVPQLRLDVMDETSRPIYYWTLFTPKRKLAPFESVHFRSRLANPPQKANAVGLSFMER